MNIAYAISDLALAAACAAIAVRAGKARPGIALACATIGAAAVFGVLRYLEFAGVGGTHRFLSLIGGVAALPLLAASVAWPGSQVASTVRGSALMLLVSGAIGVAAVVGAKLALYGQAVPALSALAILFAVARRREARRIAGAFVLVATFGAVAANLTLGPLQPVELLHYGMAVALLFVCL